MGQIKLLGILALVGAVVGAVLATLVTPGLVAWYNTASDVNALCNCATVAKSTLEQLIRAQLIGAGAGAVALPILGAVVSLRRKKQKTPPTPASPPGSAA